MGKSSTSFGKGKKATKAAAKSGAAARWAGKSKAERRVHAGRMLAARHGITAATRRLLSATDPPAAIAKKPKARKRTKSPR